MGMLHTAPAMIAHDHDTADELTACTLEALGVLERVVLAGALLEHTA